MTISNLTHVYRSNAAYELGREHGRNAASRVEINAENASRILKGIEEGDPEILDTLPIVPDLSGEWADVPNGPTVYRTICENASYAAGRDGATVDEYDAINADVDFTDLLDLYEGAYMEAAEHEITATARYHADPTA